MQCARQPQLRLVAAGKLIPHAKKAESSGNDAFFVTAAGLGAFGIADGVTACQEDGLNSAADSARALIISCAKGFEPAPVAAHTTTKDDSEKAGPAAAAAAAAGAGAIPDPADVMAGVQGRTLKLGSAAVLLAALQQQSQLQVATTGGCRMLLLRGGAILQETELRVHGVDDVSMPRQLPHQGLAKAAQQAGTAHDTDRATWDVQEGDLLIAGSDGLFNNLFTDDMAPLAHQALCGYTCAAQHPTTASSTASSSSSTRISTGGGWGTIAAAQPAAVQTPDGVSATDPAASSDSIDADYVQAAVEHAAALLAAAAAKNAASRWARVPAAQPAGGAGAGCLLPWLMCRGGKLDDITCVVALVTQRGAQHGSSTSSTTCSSAAAAVAAAGEAAGGESAGVYQECVEHQAGAVHRASSVDRTHSCHSQGDDAAAAAAAGEASLAEVQLEDLAVPAAAAGSLKGAAAGKENAHQAMPAAAAAAAAEAPGAATFNSHAALSAVHGAVPQKQPSSADSSSSSRSSNVSTVTGAASSTATGSSRPPSAAGSYSSASEHSVPPIKITRASSTCSGRVRLMPKSSYSTAGSTAGSVAVSTAGGYYLRAPKLGDSPTHVKREAARRRSSSSRMLLASSASTPAAAAAAAFGGRVSRSAAMSELVDGGSLEQQMQHGQQPEAAAPAVAAAAEPAGPAELEPAGKDSAGQQLYIGSRVAVITELGVAATGRVKLLPGQKIDKWIDDKVWPGHLGVGDIRVSRAMQEVAQQTKFWVKCEGHKLYGNHPAYTFWSKRQQLQEQHICVSIPCSSLKLMQ